MKNGLLLLLFILALSSCTIEKRRYFKGYHIENGRMGPFDRLRDRGNGEMGKRGSSTGSGNGEEGKRESEKVGKRESVLEEQCAESEPKKPQRGDIVIAGDIVIEGDIVTSCDIIINDKTTAIDRSNAGDTTPDSDVQKPHRGDIVIRSPEDATTANSPLPIQNAARVMGHKTSHALEGLGAIFLIGIISLVVVVGLIIFLLSDSAIAGLIGGLLVGLLAAIGIYLLLIFLFVALLLFIIKTFGA